MKDQIQFPGKKNYTIAKVNYAFGYIPENCVAMACANQERLSIYGLEEAEVMSAIAHAQGGNPSVEGPDAERRYITACLEAGHLINQVSASDTEAVNQMKLRFGVFLPLPSDGLVPLLSSLMLAFDATTPEVKPRVVMVTEIRKKYVIVDSAKSDAEAERIAARAFGNREIPMDGVPSACYTTPYPMLFTKEEQQEIQHI